MEAFKKGVYIDMKKFTIFLLVLSLMAIPLVGCSSDEKPQEENNEQLELLLSATAYAVSQNNVQGFNGTPDAAFVDAFLSHVLYTNAYPKGEISVLEQDDYLLVLDNGIEELYSLYFTEGSYPGVVADGFATQHEDGYAFTTSSSEDITYSFNITKQQELENGNLQITATLVQKNYADDLTQDVGEFTIVVQPSEDSFFGYRLVSVEGQTNVDLSANVLGDEPSETIEVMQPLLDSIAKAAYTTQSGFEQQPSGAFAWQTIYYLLSDYPEEYTSDITRSEDGSIIVPQSTMAQYFKNCFSYSFGTLPDIPSSLATYISYEPADQTYRIACNPQSGYHVNVDETESLNHSAAITLTLMKDVNEDMADLLATVVVEVVPAEDVSYFYQVQNVYYSAL